jgi:hypothetical protein
MKPLMHETGRVPRLSLLAGLLCWAGVTQGVTCSVTPSSISNTYTGPIAIQVSGLTTGATVAIEKYLDANANGIIDTNDWLMESFRMTDGQPTTIGGKTNIAVPNDLTPSNGVITTQWSLPAAFFAHHYTAPYLYRLSSPAAQFAPMTNSFTITDTTYPQWITGKVQCNGTNVPYAGIILFPPPSGDGGGSPVGGTVTDGSGTYTIKVLPGAYQLWAVKSGYVWDMSTAPTLNVSSNAVVTTNLTLAPATRTISGRFVNATNTSIGLPGIFVAGFSADNRFATTFSGTNGAFSLPVAAGQWNVSLPYEQPASLGYVGLRDYPMVDTSISNVPNLQVALPKGTALFYGTVKDDQNHPLSGLSLNVDDNNQYDMAGGPTDSNGNYAVAVVPGDWRVEISGDSRSAYSNYSFSARVSTNIVDGQAVCINFTASIGVTVSGRVLGNGTPLSGVYVQIGTIAFGQGGNWGWQQLYYSNGTDSNGNYSLTLPPGTNYYARVNLPQGSSWLQQFYSNATDASSATAFAALTNAPATNINFNLQQGATVSGRVLGNGAPLSGLNVQVGTVTFQQGGGWDWQDSYYSNDTDSNGNYSVTVPPGTNYYAKINLPDGSPWLEQWYSNATDISGATVIIALTNAPASNIGFNLQRGAVISGCVRGGGVPLSGVSLEVGTITFQQGGGWNWGQKYYGPDTDSNGNYSRTVAPGTNYYVVVHLPGGSPWMQQWYSNATDATSARAITTLTNAPATNINFNLQMGAMISGSVYGGGLPLADVNITVGTITFSGGGQWDWLDRYYQNTDPSGNYSIAVPPGTNYYAVATAHQGPWQQQFYSNATDASSATAFAALTNAPATGINFDLQQMAPLEITTTSLVDGMVGVYYEQQLSASGGQPPYWWLELGGTVVLPPGDMHFDHTNGIIYGTPSTEGTYPFWIQVSDNAGPPNVVTQMFSITIHTAAPPLQVTTTWLPNGTNGTVYSQTLQASGGQLPYTWALADYSADLPPNLTLATNGVLSGTLATSGTFPFVVQVTDGAMSTAEQPLSLTIVEPPPAPLVITNVSIPNGTIGAPYSVQFGATGGHPPYAWQIYSGSANPPANLTLDPSGLLSGTPATNKPPSFKVQVTDTSFATTNKVFSILINPRPVLNSPSWMTNRFQMWLNGGSNQDYTVQLSTNLTSTNWIFLYLTNSATTNSFLVTDPNATGPLRFYRVLVGQ